jgi:hypothetical protein
MIYRFCGSVSGIVPHRFALVTDVVIAPSKMAAKSIFGLIILVVKTLKLAEFWVLANCLAVMA